MPPRNTTLPTPADPKLESILEGFDDGLSYKILRYRGVPYRLDELPIGEYQKLETQATVSKENDAGETVETVDNVTVNKLLVLAAISILTNYPDDITSKRQLDLKRVGTALYVTLQNEAQKLHFTFEADELRKAKKAVEDDKGTAKGNG
jgi:hypothetical protein